MNDTMTIERPRIVRGGPARLAPARPVKFNLLLSEHERAELDELAVRAGFGSAASYTRARLFSGEKPPAA